MAQLGFERRTTIHYDTLVRSSMQLGDDTEGEVSYREADGVPCATSTLLPDPHLRASELLEGIILKEDHHDDQMTVTVDEDQNGVPVIRLDSWVQPEGAAGVRPTVTPAVRRISNATVYVSTEGPPFSIGDFEAVIREEFPKTSLRDLTVVPVKNDEFTGFVVTDASPVIMAVDTGNPVLATFATLETFIANAFPDFTAEQVFMRFLRNNDASVQFAAVKGFPTVNYDVNENDDGTSSVFPEDIEEKGAPYGVAVSVLREVLMNSLGACEPEKVALTFDAEGGREIVATLQP